MIPTSFSEGNPPASGTLELLMEVELPVLVRFGHTRMPLSQLMKMTAGSVIEFGPAPENAVEVMVNGRVIARGVAVSVQGNYGVRISELVAGAPENLAAASGLEISDSDEGRQQ